MTPLSLTACVCISVTSDSHHVLAGLAHSRGSGRSHQASVSRYQHGDGSLGRVSARVRAGAPGSFTPTPALRPGFLFKYGGFISNRRSAITIHPPPATLSIQRAPHARDTPTRITLPSHPAIGAQKPLPHSMAQVFILINFTLNNKMKNFFSFFVFLNNYYYFCVFLAETNLQHRDACRCGNRGPHTGHQHRFTDYNYGYEKSFILIYNLCM